MNKSTLIITILGVFSSLSLLAQSAPPASTPIDGGLGLLLAGGAIYGVKKIRDHRKKM